MEEKDVTSPVIAAHELANSFRCTFSKSAVFMNMLNCGWICATTLTLVAAGAGALKGASSFGIAATASTPGDQSTPAFPDAVPWATKAPLPSGLRVWDAQLLVHEVDPV